MRPSNDFKSEDEYLDYLEEVAEEEEEEEESVPDPKERDFNDLVSEADLAALAEDEDDEPSSETASEREGDEKRKDDTKSEGDEPEVDEPDTEEADADAKEEAEEGAAQPRRSTAVATIESVEDGLKEVNSKLDDIDARRDKLEADWDDGEIEDRDDYKQQLRALKVEEREITRQERLLDRQRDRIEQNNERIQGEWEDAVYGFMSDNPDYARNEDLQGVLRAKIAMLGQNQSWLDKGNEALLAEALRLSDTSLGRAAAPVESVKDEVGSRRDAMKGRGKKVTAPKTLGGLPAAEASPLQSDEFTALDNLSFEDREQAMARMSPDKYAKYMAQSSV